MSQMRVMVAGRLTAALIVGCTSDTLLGGPKSQNDESVFRQRMDVE